MKEDFKREQNKEWVDQRRKIRGKLKMKVVSVLLVIFSRLFFIKKVNLVKFDFMSFFSVLHSTRARNLHSQPMTSLIR